MNSFNIDLEGTNFDSTYDPAFMEEDGDHDVDFEWDFQPLTTNNKPKASFNMCNGLGSWLKRGVAKSFTMAMQCLGKCDGMYIDFFRCITANSNQCAYDAVFWWF